MMRWSKFTGPRFLVKVSLFFAAFSSNHREHNSGNIVGLVAGSTEAASDKLAVRTKSDACWVYNHMNKSGGTTVKVLLKRYAYTEHVPYGVVHNHVYEHGESAMKRFLEKSFTITAGGYSEGLRAFGGRTPDCKWFTVFRHPISRLVSAYFYCMENPDQLCGYRILKPESVDLLTFARHWGNYGLRQYVLSFLDQDEILAAAAESEMCHARGCPAWYTVKLYLQKRFEEKEGGSPVESSDSKAEPSLAEFLEPVKALLGSSYTAVGLLEDWDNTMSLFDRSLQLPNLNWTFEASHVSAQKLNVDQVKIDTLANAWDDAELKNLLWLDILLYEHAVTLHDAQLSEHGLA